MKKLLAIILIMLFLSVSSVQASNEVEIQILKIRIQILEFQIQKLLILFQEIQLAFQKEASVEVIEPCQEEIVLPSKKIIPITEYLYFGGNSKGKPPCSK